MGRLCTLLFLLAATAHAQTLRFGPERALAPQKFISYDGPVSVAGVATHGPRDLVIWAPVVRYDDPFRDNAAWYATFIGGETMRLRTDAIPKHVIWSGAAFFVFMDDGHAMRVSRDGKVSPLPVKFPRGQVAANGDGFIEVFWDGASLHARLYDRNGVQLREMAPLDARVLGQLFVTTAENGDYVVIEYVITDARTSALLRVVVHPDGSRDVQPINHPVFPTSAFEVAGDAVVIDKTLLLPGAEIKLDEHGSLIRDGATYLVMAPKTLRRFTKAGSLIDTTPGDYSHVFALIPRRGRKPLIIRTTETKTLLANDRPVPLRQLVDQTNVAASSDGTNTVVAWRERNVLKVKILGRHETASVPLETTTYAIRAISIPGLHFVVWFEERSVRMLRVAADGTLPDPTPVVLAKTARQLYGWGWAPALATNGRELFVAWPEYPKTRARHVTRDGVADEPCDLDIGSLNSQAMFDGEHYVVFSFELGSGGIPFGPEPPQRLVSVLVDGREAAPPVVIAKDVGRSASLVLTPSQAVWWDYTAPYTDNPSVLPDGTVLQPPMQVYLRSVRLGPGGMPKLNPFDLAHAEHPSGFWVPVDLAVASEHLLWTQEHDIDAMPIGGGEAVRIGPADGGSLNVVPTNDGPLLVYTNDGTVVTRALR